MAMEQFDQNILLNNHTFVILTQPLLDPFLEPCDY